MPVLPLPAGTVRITASGLVGSRPVLLQQVSAQPGMNGWRLEGLVGRTHCMYCWKQISDAACAFHVPTDPQVRCWCCLHLGTSCLLQHVLEAVSAVAGVGIVLCGAVICPPGVAKEAASRYRGLEVFLSHPCLAYTKGTVRRMAVLRSTVSWRSQPYGGCVV